VTLKRLEVQEARESLGVFIATNGNQNAQTRALQEKAVIWADRVCMGRFTHAKAWYSLQFCVMKALEYPLMATSPSKTQCEIIMKLIQAAALPAMGINSHLTLTIVHGPQKYQGLGILDLWTVQSILKLWLALQHGDAPTINGNQLRASMKLHTIEIGLPSQLMQQDFKIYGQLATISWLKHPWEFCDDSNIQMRSTMPKLTLAREDKFATFGYRNNQLTQLNLCRLACHAIRLSDITTGNGCWIQMESWNGQPADSAGTEYEWPEQEQPNQAAWDLWRSAIRQCYLTLQMTQQQLQQPMGKWINKTPKKWKWFYSPSQDPLYQRTHQDKE
jgi:hypothetical protein